MLLDDRERVPRRRKRSLGALVLILALGVGPGPMPGCTSSPKHRSTSSAAGR